MDESRIFHLGTWTELELNRFQTDFEPSWHSGDKLSTKLFSNCVTDYFTSAFSSSNNHFWSKMTQNWRKNSIIVFTKIYIIFGNNATQGDWSNFSSEWPKHSNIKPKWCAVFGLFTNSSSYRTWNKSKPPTSISKLIFSSQKIFVAEFHWNYFNLTINIVKMALLQ